MTQEERREWELVSSEESARLFIDAFRARRDPDFVAEVERRTALVDERLALGETKASATLRGRIAVLLGGPAELRLRHIPVATVGNVTHALGTRKGVSTDAPPQPNMIGNGAGWVEYTFHYPANRLLGIGPEGWTIVIEANAASGRDRLRHRRDKKDLDTILEAAARRSIRH